MSFRNNEDRVGARPNDAPPVEQISNKTDHEFSFATPTQFVDLPSKGKFYSEEHPLHNRDTIEIRFMTAKDEDILTSRTLLQKGIAIDRLLQNVLVDKTINPDDLLIGDKNALIVAARVTGYGAEYSARVTCPVCGTMTSHSFDLEKLNIHVEGESEESGISCEENGNISFELPKSKVQVTVRPLTGNDEKKLLGIAEAKRKHKLPESSLTDQIRMMLVSVNGTSEANTINSFIENMPASDSRYLRTTYASVIPDVNLNQSFTCPACAVEEEVMVPFTTDFFWPK